MLSQARVLLIGALLTAGSLAAQAQTAPTPATTTPAPAVPAATTAARGPIKPPQDVSGNYKDYLNQRYANDREAQAAIHLFARKQIGSALWLGTGAAFISWATTLSGSPKGGSGTATVTVTPLGYIAMLGLFGGVGVGKVARFNNTRLYKALLDYDNTSSFPDYVVAKLKDKDYK